LEINVDLTPIISQAGNMSTFFSEVLVASGFGSPLMGRKMASGTAPLRRITNLPPTV
jgi:hypothetical protein